jgi:hypothetical protein
MSWRKAWWNPVFHKRANLILFPDELRLANDPWFTLTRNHVQSCLGYIERKKTMVKTICSGGLANESLFAIIMHGYKQLNSRKNGTSVINAVTHLADWSRMDSATSPHTFKEGNIRDIQFIEENLEKNKCAMFIRKIAREFPDEILKKYIQKKDDHIIFMEPLIFIYRRWILRICSGLFIFCLL